MDRFNSIFELFATFNFAYVLYSDFTSNLHMQLTTTFVQVEKKLEGIEQILKNNQNYIEESIDKNREGAKKLEPCAQDNTDMIKQYESFKSDIRAEIRSYGITPFFNYYCFFAGFYCLVVLFINGLGVLEKDNFDGQNIFLLFNALCSISIFILALSYKRSFVFFKTTHISTIMFFCGTLIVIGTTCFMLHILKMTPFCKYYWLFYFNLATSIIISVLHFVYYFYKAVMNVYVKGKKALERVNDFGNKCQTLSTRIATTIENHNEWNIGQRSDSQD